MDKKIAQEIIEMQQADHELRERLFREGKLSLGYNPDMERLHNRNAQRLSEIIELHGYPTQDKAGKKASQAAWLIIQHAIGRPAFMRQCYELLSEIKEEINAQNLAYLHDRISYFEGKPQRFGTQYDQRGIYPVEDKMLMAGLRAELKLPAHDPSLITECGKGAEGPDLHQSGTEFYHWRRKTGWI